VTSPSRQCSAILAYLFPVLQTDALGSRSLLDGFFGLVPMTLLEKLWKNFLIVLWGFQPYYWFILKISVRLSTREKS
jgi:hypothetical protein